MVRVVFLDLVRCERFVIMNKEREHQLELIRKEVEEKLKNYYLVSNYKEQLDYLFDQLKDYDFCQEIPLIDVTGDKEKGMLYINLYRNDHSKNYE